MPGSETKREKHFHNYTNTQITDPASTALNLVPSTHSSNYSCSSLKTSSQCFSLVSSCCPESVPDESTLHFVYRFILYIGTGHLLNLNLCFLLLCHSANVILACHVTSTCMKALIYFLTSFPSVSKVPSIT